MRNLLACLCGILTVPHFHSLPPFHPGVILLLLGLLYWRRLRLPALYALGVSWGIIAGQQLLAMQLPVDWEGVDLQVSGEVIDLPQHREVGQRFLFRAETVEPIVQKNASSINSSAPFSVLPDSALPLTILLTDYGDSGVQVGERWQFIVRLKRPRALVNEGGFDYQRWLLSHGIGATGYIRAAAFKQALPATGIYPVQRFRSDIQQWISTTASVNAAGPLLALAIGDNNAISPAQWQLFRATGTGHLMAISGLHIGLLAVCGFFLGRLLAALLTVVFTQWRCLRYLPHCISGLCATAYAALAGFGLPTQRALVMVLLLNLALIAGRAHYPLRALLLAALVIVLLDPLAGMDMGFWLSFGAVAVLVFYFQHRRQTALQQQPMRRNVRNFLAAQAVVFVGLCIPLIAFNTQLSLLSPIANLFVIPWLSFFSVIPLLLAIVLHALGLGIADNLLQLAGLNLEIAWRFLQGLQQLNVVTSWSPAAVANNFGVLVLAVCAAAVLLCARGLPGRWLSGLLFLPLLFPVPPAPPALRLTVLDVGQGLAVVVRTSEHTLLYDTGARFSDRFDIGEAVVLTYLRYHGIDYLDTMIISHGDNDHAGGAASILEGIQVDKLVVGESLPALAAAEVSPQLCDQSQHWQWQDVTFKLLRPKLPNKVRDNNNLSCVLLISFAGNQLLLPGDIEAPVERALLAQNLLPQPVQTVIAPHHGSNTSSTTAFIDHTQPERVLVSAAYRSRYGHPHPLVTERYRKSGATIYNTASSGQIDLVVDDAGKITVRSLREYRPRYWY